MIQEIVNFVKDLEQNDPEIHLKNVELREGLYLFVSFDENGKIEIKHRLAYYDSKYGDIKTSKEQVRNENFALYTRCLSIQQLYVPVSSSKIFNPNAKIFGLTCTPFAIGFNKKNMDGDGNNRDAQLKKVKEAVIQYFDSARRYLEGVDDELKTQYTRWYASLSEFCKHHLTEFMESIEDYSDVKAGGVFYTFIILDEPDLEDFRRVYDHYFTRNIFNKEEFNKEDSEGRINGVPDSLYTYNNKKPFLQHQSSPFRLKYRTSAEDAKVVWQFYNLQRRILPNPLPLFIDKRELNHKVVSLYHEDKKESFTDIIQSLFNERKEDLGGFYLLFFQKGTILDIDYVPNFQYHVEDCSLRQAHCLNCNYLDKNGLMQRWKYEGIIKDIFTFQNRIANKVLGLELETATKTGSKWLKYFGDVDYNPKYMTDVQYNLFLKYRLSFYNYVYKSQRKSITKPMFDEIMVNGIMDDIRHDEVKDNKHTKQYDIKEKILIWFSLFDFFELHNLNKKDMINQTQELFEALKAYAKNDGTKSVDLSPELFAFASGQLIREILQKSKSDKRSHALLEPFLQKTDLNLFKLAIAKSFETYKHEFTLYGGNRRYEFDKVMSLVMGATDNSLNVKELLPFILAGYFSDSVFAKEKASENED